MVKCDIRWNIGNDFRSNYGQIKSAVSRKTFYQYSQDIVGKWIGRLLSFSYYRVFSYNFSISNSFNGRSNKLFARRNPTWAIVMPFMWIGLYLIMGGINSIARMFEIIFPITVFIFNHFLYEYRNIRDR